jgi:hypothetical protein
MARKASNLGYMKDNYNEVMRRLAKAEAARAQQGVDEITASRDLVRATRVTKYQTAQRAETGVSRARAMLLTSAAQRVALVSAGQGVKITCKFSAKGDLTAYYDHKVNVATVQMPIDFLDHALRVGDDGALVDRVALEHATRVTLGVGYHEVGHGRFSPDFMALLDAEGIESNISGRRIFRAWNSAEDGRMETLVAYRSPRIANYFTHMVLHLFAMRDDDTGKFTVDRPSSYGLIAARRYLPAPVRAMFRSAFVAEYGRDLAGRLDAAVEVFMRADLDTLIDASRALADLYDEINGLDHSFTDGEWGFNNDPSGAFADADDYDDQDIEAAIGAFAIDFDEDDEDDDETAEGGNRNDRYGSDDEDSEDDEDPEDDEDSGSTDRESSDDYGTDGNKANEDGATEEADSVDTSDFDPEDDAAVEETMAGVIEAVSVIGNEPLAPASVSGFLTGEQESRADDIADRLAIQMHAAASVNAPHWASRVDNGILNGFDYRTRAVGDLNFYRRQEGDRALGFNATVSVLLDTSYSMSAYMVDLSIAAHAIRRTCEAMEIPCNILTFSTGAHVLYRAEDPIQSPAPRLTDDGGTDPEEALVDLDRHRDSTDTPQIVFFFTDGAFSCPVERFAGRTNRTFVGIAYKTPAYGLKNNGIRDARELGDILDLPELVGDALVAAALA